MLSIDSTSRTVTAPLASLSSTTRSRMRILAFSMRLVRARADGAEHVTAGYDHDQVLDQVRRDLVPARALLRSS